MVVQYKSNAEIVAPTWLVRQSKCNSHVDTAALPANTDTGAEIVVQQGIQER